MVVRRSRILVKGFAVGGKAGVGGGMKVRFVLAGRDRGLVRSNWWQKGRTVVAEEEEGVRDGV